MIREAIQIHSAVEEAHRVAYQGLLSLREKCVTMNQVTDLADLADNIFALKRALLLTEDIRKEANKTIRLCEKICCMVWLVVDQGGPIRTEYTTASPTVKEAYSIPSRHTAYDLYEEMMVGLGVPEELWEGDHDVVRPHWPGLSAWLTERLSQGLPLPAGLHPDKSNAVYSVTCRKRKSIPNINVVDQDGQPNPSDHEDDLGWAQLGSDYTPTKPLKRKKHGEDDQTRYTSEEDRLGRSQVDCLGTLSQAKH